MIDTKKAIIFGQTRLCNQCSEILLVNKWSISAIISEDKIVMNWAANHFIKCLPFSQLDTLDEDNFYLFSIINPHIIPNSFLTQKNIYLGLNYHDSLLPKYAGINSTTWAIINDEEVHGVTLHTITIGVDKGDIAEQSLVNITLEDTALSLNLKCSEQLLKMFQSVINKIAHNSLQFTQQILKERTYYGLDHIPSNYAIIDNLSDIDGLSRLIRSLEFGNEENQIATVKVYLNNRFYIITDINVNTNPILVIKIKDIYGHPTCINININTCIPYTLKYTDVQYLAKIKSIEKNVKKHFGEILNSGNLLTVLRNTNSNDDHFSTTLEIPENTHQSTVLAIIYFVLIRYFHEDFIISLYVANNHIPDSLIYLVEQRNFIIAFKKLLDFNFSFLEQEFSNSIKNSHTIIKDFFYRYKLKSDTDIAFVIGDIPEIDQHKLVINLVNNQIRVNSTKQYQLQVSGLIECVEAMFTQKDILVQANLKTFNILNKHQYKQVTCKNSNIEFPHDKTIIQLFEEQVTKAPNNIAITYKHIQLTYNDLNIKANRLAHYLLNTYLIKKNELILLCLNRSENIIITILGVLKVGAAYVPIDPEYPQERVSYIIADTRSKFIIVNEQYKNSLASLVTNQIVIDNQTTLSVLDSQPKNNPTVNIMSTDLAYIIYTSGTTGKPKGVLQQHYNVIRLFKATEDWYHFNSNDVWTLFHSYIFDFSVWEIWGALLYGGRLIIPDIIQVKDTSLFYDLCYQEKVSVLNQTPQSFYQFIEIALDKFQKTPLNNLRYVILGGDALQTEILTNWFNLYSFEHTTLVNMYGITETTVHVTYQKINQYNGTAYSGIGLPIPDMYTYILDDNLKPLPIGAVGELYIGGAGLARGYLNQPELTAERFITNPFQTRIEHKQNKNSRLYKTGDLVRMLPDGNIEYIGRNDFQVKIRGYRIELGEIEHTLMGYPDIKQAVVLARSYENNQSTSNNFNKDKYLIAYYTVSHPIHKNSITFYLRNKLPEYMIPKYLVQIEHIPLTINGKLDINELPSIKEVAASYQHLSPQNETQSIMCYIVAEILALDINLVGINDDFFNLGGDSILAIRVVSKINKHLNTALSVVDIYKYKTIMNLDERLRNINVKNIGFKYIPFSLIDINKYESQLQQNNIEDIYPASYLQIGMLLASSLDAAVYHDVLCYRIRAFFYKDKFLKVWKHLINKHQLLRSRFIYDNIHTYLLIVTKTIPVNCVVYSNLDIKQIVDKEILNKFDYEHFGLFRLIINQYGDDFDLIFSLHHAIADGWSVASIINEFIQAYVYDKFTDNSYFNICYANFVEKEREALKDEDSINFWQQYLSDMGVMANKWKFDRDNHSLNSLFISSFSVEEHTATAIHNIARLNYISIDTIFLYAYLETLAFFLNTSDVMIGLVTNNRIEQEWGDELIGVFLNTIPYKFGIDHTKNINQNLIRVFNGKINLNRYKHIPYGYIKSLIKYDIFEVAFNFINFHILNDSLSMITDTYVYEKSNIPLLLNVYQSSNEFRLELVAHDNYIDQEYLNYFAKYLRIILLTIVNSSNESFMKPVLDAQDYHKLIYDLNQTNKPYTLNKTIQQLFEDQVIKTPYNIALVYQDTKITYNQLNIKANQIAHYIKAIFTINPDDVIALCLDRSEIMIITILAVLKIGAAYVPIDPNYPKERIRYILDDANPRLVLTNESNKQKIVNSAPHLINNLVLVDNLLVSEKLKTYSFVNINVSMNNNNLAYIIYTSGTTGKPNGVMVEHSSVINTILSLNVPYDFTLGTRVTEFTNYVFDVSVAEIFVTLLNGAELHILPDNARIDPHTLSQYLIDNKINFSYLPPLLLAKLPTIDYPVLKSIIYAGEPCLNTVGEYWSNVVNLYNYYGPTESSIYTIGKKVINGDTNLIGKPIPNHQAYILNDNFNPLPIGAIGELYIGGLGLARGYLNQQELTAERFITNPFQTEVERKQNKNSRLYKTGDLVRMFPDGNIEYIGRNDFQVKIRGYRIELGEIEQALISYPDITQAVALIVGDNADTQHIVAYYLSCIQLDDLELYGYLSTKLPKYMLPSQFVHVKEFQMNINGKLERSLLSSYTNEIKNIYDEPKFNELEKQICQIVQQVINIPVNLNSTSNFFAIGGNSILAINLLNRINAKFNIQLKVSDIFNGKTIERISKRVSQFRLDFELITKLGETYDKTNIFMVHPAFAGAEIYVELAEHLSDKFSCYGIENYNLYNKDKIINLNRLASYYLSEIDKIRVSTDQKNHPYVLLGWSLGGQIALEIASILEVAGHKDIKLILIDTALTDSRLSYYYESKLSVDTELYYEFLEDNNYLDEYSSKIIGNIECDIKLVQQATTNKLIYSKVLLFKAMQYGVRKYLKNYSFHGRYIITLPYNNIDKIMDINNINLTKVDYADHFNILTNNKLIANNTKLWYNLYINLLPFSYKGLSKFYKRFNIEKE